MMRTRLLFFWGDRGRKVVKIGEDLGGVFVLSGKCEQDAFQFQLFSNCQHRNSVLPHFGDPK